MEPTLGIGSRFMVLKVGDPEVGDIIVAHPPAGAERDETCGSGPPPIGEMCAKPTPEQSKVSFVKRVAAVGGDRISMARGQARPQRQARDHQWPSGLRGRRLRVPAADHRPKGHLFLLGDNRGSSDDSRFWGPVPEDAVVGKLWFAYTD